MAVHVVVKSQEAVQIEAGTIPLQLVGNDFLKELPQSVQKNNWVECLRDVVGRFPRFGDNYRFRVFEVVQPDTHRKTGIR